MIGTDSLKKSQDNTYKNLQIKRMSYFYIIIAAILWGTVGILGKKLGESGFDNLQIVFIRAMGACVALSLFLLIKDKNLFKIKPRHFIYFIGTGILSFVFFNWCYFIAVNKTSIAAAAILLYTAPTIIMVLSSILFKEKMTQNKILSLVLTFIGCLLVTVFVQGTGQQFTITGILAGLGAGFGYALYSIFGRYALEKYHSLTVTCYTFIFASIGLVPITDIKEMFILFSDINAIIYAILLSMAGTVMPFLLYTKGLSNLETGNASIIATLEPVVAALLGIILYNEPVTVFKIAGISLVIFALYIIREKKHQQ
ncbi:putative inner membrane transporter YicL [Oxobacter pfennigii]|uniref:Putative inner membrane transporter YicL n=1 Tax=Oxobacter pfennigii TaxID=36849 RepID=A0A0P8X4A8_9CLOT|nr:EamA family transporter [Oxobacter pfennigii]KPU45627.1 putative inner membrane transporter YicL [Oxobacter pfennigii]